MKRDVTDTQPYRVAWFQRASMIAIWSATLAATLGSRNLLFPDEVGFVVVVLSCIGMASSYRMQQSGRMPIPPLVRRSVNLAIVALSSLGVWAYLVHSGLLASWFDFGGFHIMRIGVYEAVRTLLFGILSLTTVRCFALFTQRDLLLTLIPALSVLLLLCVLDPSGDAMPYVAWFAVSAWIALAIDQRLRLLSHRWAQPDDASGLVASLGQTGASSHWTLIACGHVLTPDAQTSLFNVAVVLVFAIALSNVITKWTMPGNSLQGTGVRLAWYLARFMVDTSRTPFTGYSAAVMVSGPPPPMGNQLMLRVRSDVAGYWRGRCFEEFDGGTWHEARLHKSYRLNGRVTSGSGRLRMFQVRPEEDEVDGVRLRAVSQRYNIEGIQMGTILSLAAPRTVSAPVERVRVDRHGCVSCSRSFVAGDHYSVVSLVADDGDDVLCEIVPPSTRAIQICLALPDSTTERTRALARRIVRRARDDESKARAIADHLQREYTYSLGVWPYPRGHDPVDYFLFEAESGYCVQFATAMAILSRAVGVPARLVTGYCTGALDRSTGTYAVRESDAHAWVEVHIGGRIWKRFDPTPAYVTRRGTVSSPLQQLSRAMQHLFAAAASLGLFSLRFSVTAPGITVAFVLMLTAVIAYRAPSRARFLRGKKWRGAGGSPSATASAMSEILTLFLRRIARGYQPRRPSETLMEYVQAAVPYPGTVRDHAVMFATLYARARYGTAPPTATDLKELKRLANAWHNRKDRRRS